MNESIVDSIEYAPIRMRRVRPFVIASHSSEEAVNVLVRLRSNKNQGMGAIAPNQVTGDTEASSIRFLEELSTMIIGKRLNAASLHEQMGSLSSTGLKRQIQFRCAAAFRTDKGIPVFLRRHQRLVKGHRGPVTYLLFYV